jgi:hypothetical protein
MFVVKKDKFSFHEPLNFLPLFLTLSCSTGFSLQQEQCVPSFHENGDGSCPDSTCISRAIHQQARIFLEQNQMPGGTGIFPIHLPVPITLAARGKTPSELLSVLLRIKTKRNMFKLDITTVQVYRKVKGKSRGSSKGQKKKVHKVLAPLNMIIHCGIPDHDNTTPARYPPAPGI